MVRAPLGKVHEIISSSNPHTFAIGEIGLKYGSTKYSGKDKVKSQTKVTPRCSTPTKPNQCLYQVSSSYNLRLLRYNPDKIFKLKVTMARSKRRSHHDVAHLQPPTNILSKYQLLHRTVSEI